MRCVTLRRVQLLLLLLATLLRRLHKDLPQATETSGGRQISPQEEAPRLLVTCDRFYRDHNMISRARRAVKGALNCLGSNTIMQREGVAEGVLNWLHPKYCCVHWAALEDSILSFQEPAKKRLNADTCADSSLHTSAQLDSSRAAASKAGYLSSG